MESSGSEVANRPEVDAVVSLLEEGKTDERTAVDILMKQQGRR